MHSILLPYFFAGLLGGGHCLGMCGGLVTAFTLQLPSSRSRWPFIILFNVGRLASYVLVGVLAGAFASAMQSTQMGLAFRVTLGGVSVLLLFAMGVYLVTRKPLLAVLEKAGGRVWFYIRPFLQRLLPIRRPFDAALAGLLWGWMPCGLVYTAAVAALASGDAVTGGGIMLAFGLGTLPNLLLMGAAATRLAHWLRQEWVRRMAGVVVLSLAVWQAWLWLDALRGLGWI